MFHKRGEFDYMNVQLACPWNVGAVWSPKHDVKIDDWLIIHAQYVESSVSREATTWSN